MRGGRDPRRRLVPQGRPPDDPPDDLDRREDHRGLEGRDLTPRPVASVAELGEAVDALLASASGRVIVGIAGPPGAGKSTVTARLATRWAPPPPIVEMDGFHLPDDELDRLGRRDRKGAPDTFDAAGFVELLGAVRAAGAETIGAPRFDRPTEASVPDAVAVEPADRLVLVEGNYLLLDSSPWSQVGALLDLAVYVDLDDGIRVERLVARHVRHGRSEADARAFVLRSDEANARLVAATRGRADVVLVG